MAGVERLGEMILEDGRKKGLGRGLSALIGESAADAAAERGGPREVPIELIAPNPEQPRKSFDPDRLAELAASIREKGILQPIVVRQSRKRAPGETRYEILAGERRWRAAQMAGLHMVPVVERDAENAEALELALIENIQRADLNAIEEAEGYRRLIETYDHHQEELGRLVGKSRPHIANTLRLLSLPPAIQDLVRNGRLSAGHARALITAADPEALAAKAVAKGLSVRAIEALVKTAADPQRKRRGRPPKSARFKDADTRALENQLSAALNLSVEINDSGAKGGALTIRYRSLDELDALCAKLTATALP